MAVIQFTPADALQTVVVENGIYPSEISKIEGPSASKSGKSVSYFVDITVTEGKYKGKTHTIALNSETNNASLLGDLQFFPQSTFLLIDAAIHGKKVEAIDRLLDTDELLHKPFDSQWTVQTVEGRLINTVTGFFPKGYGSQQPGF